MSAGRRRASGRLGARGLLQSLALCGRQALSGHTITQVGRASEDEQKKKKKEPQKNMAVLPAGPSRTQNISRHKGYRFQSTQYNSDIYLDDERGRLHRGWGILPAACVISLVSLFFCTSPQFATNMTSSLVPLS